MAIVPISKNDDHSGLVFTQLIGTYLVELQTSVIPNLLHLVVFDNETDDILYQKLGIFPLGATLEGNRQLVEQEIAAALQIVMNGEDE